MEKYRITDNKNACFILSVLFWGFLLFVEFKGTILFYIFPKDLLIEYIDPVFYGMLFLVVIIIFRKAFIASVKDFVGDFKKYIGLSAIFFFVTIFLMIVSAVVIDSFGIGDSSNQQFIGEAIVQYGFLQIITACLLGPVVEEVFYRGILFEMLKGKENSIIRNIIAVILTSFIFAFMHVSLFDFSVTDMVANIPILMLGLTLTTLRCKTDNILCSVIVHIGINVIATI
ncbi:MAG: CPBP family intramembrane metalloprotease [Oscillospiraceae bacterium]|nr:CPBP family intramembrane metalloprotease [Oscillospiraceae bacterium]